MMVVPKTDMQGHGCTIFPTNTVQQTGQIYVLQRSDELVMLRVRYKNRTHDNDARTGDASVPAPRHQVRL